MKKNPTVKVSWPAVALLGVGGYFAYQNLPELQGVVRELRSTIWALLAAANNAGGGDSDGTPPVGTPAGSSPPLAPESAGTVGPFLTREAAQIAVAPGGTIELPRGQGQFWQLRQYPLGWYWEPS